MFKNYCEGYLKDVKKSIDGLDKEEMNNIFKVIYDAFENGKNIFLFGNGGSGSNADHIVNDFSKGVLVHRGKRFKAVSLNSNTALLTAWANDSSYDDVFSKQIEVMTEEGDVVVGISGSGNSKNILNGINKGNEKGAICIGITGFEGGKLKEMCQKCLVVPSNHMGRIEDIHLIFLHMLAYFMYENVKNEGSD